jgi:mRNA interferase MazF|tara:strand:+ start:483 stop:815 length:333 start_codon:yes stop_codon:yes gene_type:complete
MIKKGEIWIISFPEKYGSEQSGTRPSIIISDTPTKIAIAIPLTSNTKSLINLPFTTRIRKSPINNLEKDSVALILQIQAIDKKRLIHKIGNLEQELLNQINLELRNLLKL